MTLNCDFGIDESRARFAEKQDDGRAKDLLEAAFEYWQYDMIDDQTFAKDIRKVAEYLEQKGSSEHEGHSARYKF